MKAAAVIDMLSPRSFKTESYSRSLNVGDCWRFRGTSRCSSGVVAYIYICICICIDMPGSVGQCCIRVLRYLTLMVHVSEAMCGTIFVWS